MWKNKQENKKTTNMQTNSPPKLDTPKHTCIWSSSTLHSSPPKIHFIRDLVEKKIVYLEFINTDNQKADIFTKPLDGPRFESYVGCTPPSKALTQNTSKVWVQKGTYA